MNRGMPSPGGVGFAALNDPRLLARMASPRAPANKSANTTPTLHHQHYHQAAVSTVAPPTAATVMPPPHTVPKASSPSSRNTTSSATAPITMAATSSAASWPLASKASTGSHSGYVSPPAASYSQHCSRQISQHQPKATTTTATVRMPVPTTTSTSATNLTTLPTTAAYPYSVSTILRAQSSPGSRPSAQTIAHSNRIGATCLSAGQTEAKNSTPNFKTIAVPLASLQSLPQRQVQQASQAGPTAGNIINSSNTNNRPPSATTAFASPDDRTPSTPSIHQMPTVDLSQNNKHNNINSNSNNSNNINQHKNNANNFNTNGNTSGGQTTMPKRTHFGMKMKSRPKNRVTVLSPEPAVPTAKVEVGPTANIPHVIPLPYKDSDSLVSPRPDAHNNCNNNKSNSNDNAKCHKNVNIINSQPSPQKLASTKKPADQTPNDLKQTSPNRSSLMQQEKQNIETASDSNGLAVNGASPSKSTRNSPTSVKPSSPSQASSASFVKNITNSAQDHVPNKSNVSPTKQQTSPPKKVLGMESPFSWSTYLKLIPAIKAPNEAFRQSPLPLVNNFKIGMKLEAKDPRANSWCLATVIHVEGLRLRLRADGGDTMSDFFELIDSENIRQCGSKPMEILLPPTAFRGNLSTYPKFIEKAFSRPETVLAPEECFVKPPPKPATNLFKTGMKLEAIDRKNPHLVCPATVGAVTPTDVQILFDGWSGSFDYTCKYYSREIFPVNWCADTGHRIQPPNGWEPLLHGKPDQLRLNKSPRKSEKDSVQSKRKKKKKKMLKSPVLVRDLMSKSKLSSMMTGGETRPEMSHSTPRKQSLSTNNDIERKKDRKEVSGDETVQMKEEEDPTSDIGDAEDVELPPGVSEYQCQRTRPYDEWRKSTSQSSQTTTNEDMNMSTNSSSQSSSISNLHPSKVVTLLETPPSFEEPQTKRMKLEVPSESATRHLKKHKYDTWTVKDVLKLIKSDETLSKYSSIFETHEIDGKAFVLLTTEIMVNHMGLKIGPVLKINDLIERVKRT